MLTTFNQQDLFYQTNVGLIDPDSFKRPYKEVIKYQKYFSISIHKIINEIRSHPKASNLIINFNNEDINSISIFQKPDETTIEIDHLDHINKFYLYLLKDLTLFLILLYDKNQFRFTLSFLYSLSLHVKRILNQTTLPPKSQYQIKIPIHFRQDYHQHLTTFKFDYKGSLYLSNKYKHFNLDQISQDLFNLLNQINPKNSVSNKLLNYLSTNLNLIQTINYPPNPGLSKLLN
jgi:hypothetical protein